jgi:putative hydrolase of the HAD superfamily
VSAIQAITLDVGGTLIEPWPSVGHVYARVAAEHGLTELPPDLLNRRFVSSWKTCGERAETRADWREVVRGTFRPWPELAEAEAFFDSLYERFTEPACWRTFDDVVPTLAALQAAGFRLGILSNWDDRLRPLLDRLDLARWFEVFVVSCEQGCRKPDRRIFEIAAESLGLPPESILHVGDSWKQDVLGARAAGLQALHVCRAGAATPSGGACTTLAEVPARAAMD